ncbi:hypothetical protein, partial [Synechococcus sp. WC10meta]|uniref:hypothetical protein n=1 Tax=Synechococcus sp. WC10meta TaxID=2964537 RepID=UPI0039C41C0E
DVYKRQSANTNAYPYPPIHAACPSYPCPHSNSGPDAHLDTDPSNANTCPRACFERPVALRGRILYLEGIAV